MTQPRSRIIQPCFFLNESLAQVRFEHRLLFAGLWCLADREGRIEDRPMRIKAQLFPYDDVDVDAGLNELANGEAVIARYSVDGVKVIQILSWQRFGKPHHKEIDSILPAFDAQACVKVESSLGQDQSVLGSSTKKEKEKEKEKEIEIEIEKAKEKEKEKEKERARAKKYSPGFERFWKTYPKLRRTAKPQTFEKWKAAITRGDVTEEMLLSRVTEYAASGQGTGQFVRQPVTWLNQEGWNDPPEAWARTGSTESERSDDVLDKYIYQEERNGDTVESGSGVKAIEVLFPEEGDQ